jgi:hypothetical protein
VKTKSLLLLLLPPERKLRVARFQLPEKRLIPDLYYCFPRGTVNSVKNTNIQIAYLFLIGENGERELAKFCHNG